VLTPPESFDAVRVRSRVPAGPGVPGVMIPQNQVRLEGRMPRPCQADGARRDTKHSERWANFDIDESEMRKGLLIAPDSAPRCSDAEFWIDPGVNRPATDHRL